MNKVIIIGNLTRDPELRTTTTGINVCSFTVAVNRRNRGAQQNSNQPEADFFRVTAWRQLGELCAKFLSKGRKVCVTGAVSVSTYTGNDGATRASLEVNADEVEFLSNRAEDGGAAPVPGAPVAPADQKTDAKSGFTEVETDELPF